MDDQEQVRVKPAVDARAAADLSAKLTETLKEMSSAVAAVRRGAVEAAEVGALFRLCRDLRRTDDPEVRAQLRAAIAGYETGFLADLIVFAEYLQQEARPAWERRTR